MKNNFKHIRSFRSFIEVNLLTKKEDIKMLRRFKLNLFYNITSIAILFGMCLPGCTGSTSIQRQHHLLQEDSSSVCVSFIREEEAWTSPIEINLDGEDLLTLSEGKYTVLNLKPGKYDLVVNSLKMEKVDTLSVSVKVARNFVVDLSEADSTYILFSREKFGFWEIIRRTIIDDVTNGNIAIPLGENLTMQLGTGSKTYPGYGYTGKTVKRKTAVKIASKLKPVGSHKIR